jgi:L-malate glycosyltransferase
MARADRIRLVEFVAAFGIGGTERQVLNLGRALDRSRFDLSYACLKQWGDLLEEIDADRTPISEYPIRGLYPHETFKGQLRFVRDLRRARVEVVHAYNVYANVFAVPAARLAGTPVVVASIRDTGVYLTPMQKRVQRLACRLADCILVNADAVRRWLVEEGYPERKMITIRNGIDLSRFSGRPGDGGLRRSLALPQRAPLVAVLSRLDRNKGIAYFLEAAARVAARAPAARFLIIGDRFQSKDGAIVSDASHRQGLERHARRLGLDGRVTFTGFRLDVPELLSEVAVSVLPSLSEGLSNSVLESMAAGVPVVATRVGGTPEAIEDGVSGLLVPPRDAGSLAEAITTLLENPEMARRLGQAGKARVETHFSIRRMTDETERLYEKMLGRLKGREEARSLPPLTGSRV